MAENKKKIIIIGPVYPYRGGNALFVSHTYELLKDHFNLKIYNYKLLYPSLLFPGTTQYDESDQKVFNAPSERIINSVSLVNWISTARKLKNENADLIIFDWWHPFFGFCHGAISFLIRKYYKNRILFITENVVSHEANWFDKFLTRLGLSNASCFLALSKKVEEDLKRMFAGKNIYRSELPVYDCYQNEVVVDKNRLKKELGVNVKNKVILFFGYVRKYKGLDILIKAFKIILKEHPATTLLIVGEFYDKEKPYTDLIAKLNIGNNVKMINRFVSNEEVAKYYLASDVVVLPYRSATQSGILNVAYGFLKPVIVTDVGGLAEFVIQNKTGLVVKQESPDAIALGYNKFLKLSETEDFKRNIKEYNQKNGFENLPDIMNKILETSN